MLFIMNVKEKSRQQQEGLHKERRICEDAFKITRDHHKIRRNLMMNAETYHGPYWAPSSSMLIIQMSMWLDVWDH